MIRFHNSKLSQEGCFKTYIYYASLCAGCSTEKELMASFVKHFTENIKYYLTMYKYQALVYIKQTVLV